MKVVISMPLKDLERRRQYQREYRKRQKAKRKRKPHLETFDGVTYRVEWIGNVLTATKVADKSVERERARKPLIKIRPIEKQLNLEPNIFERVTSEQSDKECCFCGFKMKLVTYSNNFGDVQKYFECGCGQIEKA